MDSATSANYRQKTTKTLNKQNKYVITIMNDNTLAVWAVSPLEPLKNWNLPGKYLV